MVFQADQLKFIHVVPFYIYNFITDRTEERRFAEWHFVCHLSTKGLSLVIVVSSDEK